ncbi:hypothetical protein GEMRC1_001693 [Eukaryota sp. GEM-RC1]
MCIHKTSCYISLKRDLSLATGLPSKRSSSSSSSSSSEFYTADINLSELNLTSKRYFDILLSLSRLPSLTFTLSTTSDQELLLPETVTLLSQSSPSWSHSSLQFSCPDVSSFESAHEPDVLDWVGAFQNGYSLIVPLLDFDASNRTVYQSHIELLADSIYLKYLINTYIASLSSIEEGFAVFSFIGEECAPKVCSFEFHSGRRNGSLLFSTKQGILQKSSLFSGIVINL